MSSGSSGIGLSSSTSIFSGGLCSGNARRPSMFTAKYRLREERKKVLKLSLNKVRRIEDPESFLRRSVLINNTVKRLQREVREEKMLRNGGYTSKLHSMHSYRKSFASSRLNELVHSDDPIDESPVLRHSPRYSHSTPVSVHHNSRKPTITQQSDPDVDEVLSQIYIPPTPCIISTLEEEDPQPTHSSLSCLSSTPERQIKKPRLSSDDSHLRIHHEPMLPETIEVDVEIDVNEGNIESGGDWLSHDVATVAVDCVDEVMDEFRLDFHLTSPTVNQLPTHNQELSIIEEEELKASETKENTCDPLLTPLPSCCTGLTLNLPLTDHPVHHQKCPNSVNSVGNPENVTPEKQQYSSCGHSSIFGELQSVVFHSLIASLET